MINVKVVYHHVYLMLSVALQIWILFLSKKTSNGKNNKAKLKHLRIAGRSQIVDQKNNTI